MVSRLHWTVLVVCSLVLGHAACGEEAPEGEALASGATNTSLGGANPGKAVPSSRQQAASVILPLSR